jgi:hypothetical protein
LKAVTPVDATLIAALFSTKNKNTSATLRCKSSLPRLEEKHGPADEFVSDVKHVDDVRQIAANTRMRPSVN